jgi:hypothetical protein
MFDNLRPIDVAYPTNVDQAYSQLSTGTPSSLSRQVVCVVTDVVRL